MNLQASEITVSYRPNFRPIDRPKITSSKNSYAILLKSWDIDQIEYLEAFKVIYLNAANRVLGIHTASTGTQTACLADPKQVFAGALVAGATKIILAHNHPTGTLEPSKADIDLTKRMAKAGEILGIPVLDHIIVTVNGYYSFADECLL